MTGVGSVRVEGVRVLGRGVASGAPYRYDGFGGKGSQVEEPAVWGSLRPILNNHTTFINVLIKS